MKQVQPMCGAIGPPYLNMVLTYQLGAKFGGRVQCRWT